MIINFSKKDCLIIFPPVFYPHMPYFAPASLTSFLRSKGISVLQADLNVDFYNYCLQEKIVTSAYYEIIEKIRGSEFSDVSDRVKLTSSPEMMSIIELLSIAKEVIQGKSDRIPLSDAKTVIDLSLDIVSDSFYPLEIFLSGLKLSYSDRSSKEIYKSLFDTNQNIFLEYYSYVIPDLIHNVNPKMICISITAPTQLIPAFSLCKTIRSLNNKIKIVIGGNVVTRLKEFFNSKNILSEFYDFAISGEGELKLYELYEKNFVYNNENKINIDFEPPTDISLIPAPDFSDLALDNYFDLERILPIYASRRCYWDKCSFCDIPFGYDQGHRARKASDIVNEIEYLSKKYSVRNFKFVDDALPPKLAYEVSSLIIKKQLKINWEAYVILAKEFLDEDYCNTLSDGGCRWLYFGFESGDKNIIKGMKKGHNVLNTQNVIRNTSAAGIKNHLWIIVGFPGEKIESVNNSIKFVEENHQYIDSLEINQFALTKHAAIMKNSEWMKYKIKPILNEGEDLALFNDYETLDDSITQDEAKGIVIQLREYLFSKFGFSNVVRSSNLVTKTKNVTEPALMEEI